jgi:membrane-bound serine protease (ClpP class)
MPKKIIISLPVAVLLLSIFFLFGQANVKSAPATKPAPKVILVSIDNYIINPIVVKYIENGLKQANKINASCLLIKLDTPGGLLESTRRIVKDIINSPVPVVVYIAPSGSRAGSAGVFITLSSHIAAMAPSTNIGAAHPVTIFQQKSKKEPGPMENKILNDTVAWIQTIAKSRNRNASWAKRAVIESESITEKEAIRQKVVEFIALNTEDLLNQIDGTKIKLVNKQIVTLNTKGAPVEEISLSGREKILNAIINPNVAYILFLLGFLGLLFEITHPGIGVPGIAGLICILLAFYAFQILPVNYVAVAFITLAIILFIAEALTPTFGLLTLGGIVTMVLGSLMLFESPFPFMKVSLKIIIPFVVTCALISIFLLGMVIKTYLKKVKTGKEGIIGELAEAMTDIDSNKGGKVFVRGEIWNARSKEKITKGDSVYITGIKKLTLEVKKGG